MKALEFDLKIDRDGKGTDPFLASSEMIAQDPLLIEFIKQYEANASVEDLISIYEKALKNYETLRYNKKIISGSTLPDTIEENVKKAVGALKEGPGEVVPLGMAEGQATNLMNNIIIAKRNGIDPKWQEQLDEVKSETYKQTANDIQRDGLNIVVKQVDGSVSTIEIGKINNIAQGKSTLQAIQAQLKENKGWNFLNKAQQEYIMLACNQSYTAGATMVAMQICRSPSDDIMIRPGISEFMPGSENKVTVNIEIQKDGANKVSVEKEAIFAANYSISSTGEYGKIGPVLTINTTNDISKLQPEQEIRPMLFALENEIQTTIGMKVENDGIGIVNLDAYSRTLPGVEQMHKRYDFTASHTPQSEDATVLRTAIEKVTAPSVAQDSPPPSLQMSEKEPAAHQEQKGLLQRFLDAIGNILQNIKSFFVEKRQSTITWQEHPEVKVFENTPEEKAYRIPLERGASTDKIQEAPEDILNTAADIFQSGVARDLRDPDADVTVTSIPTLGLKSSLKSSSRFADKIQDQKNQSQNSGRHH